MGVLFQFFDFKHHYFTFLDYQLVPTMEEFSQLLDLPILDQMSFTGLEEFPKSDHFLKFASEIGRRGIQLGNKKRSQGFSS